jgi:hypothetical protein
MSISRPTAGQRERHRSRSSPPTSNTVPFAYTAADTVDLLVESMTGKSLSNLDAGEIHIYLAVTKLSSL